MFLPCVECCGDSIIPVNPVTICCDGELQDRPANAACCGKEAFDSSLFFCCGGVIIKKAKYLDEYLTQLKAYLHLFGVTLEEYADRFKIKVKDLLPCMQCCGEEPYIDDDNKICCDGQIQDRPPNGECCGPKAFDSVKMICCDGVIQPRPPNAACCGQKAYDRLEQYCCSGEVVDLKKKKNPLIGLLHTL